MTSSLLFRGLKSIPKNLKKRWQWKLVIDIISHASNPWNSEHDELLRGLRALKLWPYLSNYWLIFHFYYLLSLCEISGPLGMIGSYSTHTYTVLWFFIVYGTTYRRCGGNSKQRTVYWIWCTGFHVSCALNFWKRTLVSIFHSLSLSHLLQKNIDSRNLMILNTCHCQQ